MADFKRARSPEQKEFRMEEIKDAADSLFAEGPYHQINLTTIAERLSWTRANLYRYVSTKEEVFLEITEDRMNEYYGALMTAIPDGCNYSDEVLAEVWSNILVAHRDYLRYGTLLNSIVENNVPVERLARFKRTYFDLAGQFSERLAEITGMDVETAMEVQLSVFYQGTGRVSVCGTSEIIAEALRMIGMGPRPDSLREDMRTFILMNLGFYGKRRSPHRRLP